MDVYGILHLLQLYTVIIFLWPTFPTFAYLAGYIESRWGIIEIFAMTGH